MKLVFLTILIFVVSGRAIAQNNDITFASAELQSVALRYTGDTLNWPIIVSLANRNIQSNTFTLTQSDLQQLRTISDVTAKTVEQKGRIRTLITNGATIFAKDELIDATLAINSYDDAIKSGNANDAINFGNDIKPKVDDVEFALMENRMIEVQAQLEQKKEK